METIDIFNTLKHDLLEFGKVNDACKDEYGRLLRASSLLEVIEVVKDNFFWCAQFKDFGDIIAKHHDTFAEYHIFTNEDVDVHDGSFYFCITNGCFYGKVGGRASVNIASCGLSSIELRIYDSSEATVHSFGNSVMTLRSDDNVQISAMSKDQSSLHITSYGHSDVRIVGCDHSNVCVDLRDTSSASVLGRHFSSLLVSAFGNSLVDLECFRCSTANVFSYSYAKIQAKSYDTSVVRVTSDCDSSLTVEGHNNSTIVATRYHSSIIRAMGFDLSVIYALNKLTEYTACSDGTTLKDLGAL